MNNNFIVPGCFKPNVGFYNPILVKMFSWTGAIIIGKLDFYHSGRIGGKVDEQNRHWRRYSYEELEAEFDFIVSDRSIQTAILALENLNILWSKGDNNKPKWYMINYAALQEFYSIWVKHGRPVRNGTLTDRYKAFLAEWETVSGYYKQKDHEDASILTREGHEDASAGYEDASEISRLSYEDASSVISNDLSLQGEQKIRSQSPSFTDAWFDDNGGRYSQEDVSKKVSTRGEAGNWAKLQDLDIPLLNEMFEVFKDVLSTNKITEKQLEKLNTPVKTRNGDTWISPIDMYERVLEIYGDENIFTSFMINLRDKALPYYNKQKVSMGFLIDELCFYDKKSFGFLEWLAGYSSMLYTQIHKFRTDTARLIEASEPEEYVEPEPSPAPPKEQIRLTWQKAINKLATELETAYRPWGTEDWRQRILYSYGIACNAGIVIDPPHDMQTVIDYIHVIEGVGSGKNND